MLQKLQKLPDFKEQGYGPDKHFTTYHIYVRPTLEWKHECEVRPEKPITRADAILHITHDV